MPRLALLSMSPPILDADMHNIAAGIEVASLCYFQSNPPIRMLRDLSPMNRALLMGAVWYGYNRYLGVRPVSRPARDSDTLRY
jgi:hypothetical protein